MEVFKRGLLTSTWRIEVHNLECLLYGNLNVVITIILRQVKSPLVKHFLNPSDVKANIDE